MPRKHPLPEIDQAIARRLVELRTATDLSRNQLADKVRFARHLLARIELARMPLFYGHADTLLSGFGYWGPFSNPVNPLWLAYGTKPAYLNWPFLLPKADAIGLEFRTPFSQFIVANRELLTCLTKDVPEGELPEAWLQPYFLHWAKLKSIYVQSTTKVAILEGLCEFSAERLAAQSPNARRLLGQLHAAEKKISFRVLTQSSDSVISAPMKSELQELLVAARRLTRPRGMKSKLAQKLGVPLPRVSDWLAGKYLPSGERALKLRDWVREHEGQQEQSPGSVPRPPEPKTQSKASHENIPRSRPPKS